MSGKSTSDITRSAAETRVKLVFTSPRCSPRGRCARWRSSTAGSGSWRCSAADAPSSSADTLEKHVTRSGFHSQLPSASGPQNSTHLPRRSYWAVPSSDPSAPVSPCIRWRIRHSSGWSSAASTSLCTHLSHTHTHTHGWHQHDDITHRRKHMRVCHTSFMKPTLLHHTDLRHDGRGLRVIDTQHPSAAAGDKTH